MNEEVVRENAAQTEEIAEFGKAVIKRICDVGFASGYMPESRVTTPTKDHIVHIFQHLIEYEDALEGEGRPQAELTEHLEHMFCRLGIALWKEYHFGRD